LSFGPEFFIPQPYKRMKHCALYCCAVLCAFFIISCSDSNKYFSLKGQIKGMPRQLVRLEEEGISDIKLIDTTFSGKDGSFELKGIYLEPGLYRLRMNDAVLPVVIDGTSISISGTWPQLNDYQSKGSPGTGSLVRFLSAYQKATEELAALQLVADSMQSYDVADSIKMPVMLQAQKIRQETIAYIKKYADTTHSFPVAYYAALYLDPSSEQEYFKNFSGSIPKRFPNNRLASEFSEMIRKIPAEEQSDNSLQIGQEAPDFTYENPKGKKVSLKSLRGKYILLDFWASWCPPCRAENPNVVAAFNKYNGKNFSILSVSLDTDKSKWEEAISKDNLGAWIHVSELKGWNSSVVALYGVRSIPCNYLLNPEGKVIAKYLQGEDLSKALEKLLK